MLVDLIRHGSTGRSGTLDGRTDPALTSAGLAHFENALRGYTCAGIIASPRRRALAGAHSIASETHTPLTVAANWAEYDFGAWDGRTRADIEREPGGAAALAAFYDDPVAHPPPAGERWPQFSARIARALDAIIDIGGAGPLLVVTHAGAIRMALSLAVGMPRAHTWAFRITYATRLRLHIGRGVDGKIWGEIVDLVQPLPFEPTL
jgi:alpha-ribazole phosphatase